jgi:putative ABC transport system permease protein
MNAGELCVALEMGCVYAIVVMGIFLTFRMMNFADMTCDGSFVLGGCVASVLVKNGFSPVCGCIFAFFGGSMGGWLTAFLHNRFKIADILSGILVAFMLYSINLRIMGGVPNIILNGNLSGSLFLPISTFVIALTLAYLLNTDFGLALRIIGCNKRLAKSSGMNVQTMITFGLALSNGLIGLGGGFFCLTQNFCDIGSGVGTLIVSIASLVIGEKILPFRSPFIAVTSCIVGSIIYRLLIAFALHGNVGFLKSTDLNLITGLLIVATMAIQRKKKNVTAGKY